MFSGVPCLERSKITVWERHLLKKRIYYRSFEFLPALCKKVFLKAQVKWFSLYGSHNSDSAVFGNVAVGEIKACSLKATPFLKKLSMEVSSLCLPYGKSYFQEHQWSAFLFTAEITEILLFSGMRLLERSKIIVWERHLWKTNLQWKSWVVSALRIKVFSRGLVKCFSLYGSNESFCVVSGMPIW